LIQCRQFHHHTSSPTLVITSAGSAVSDIILSELTRHLNEKIVCIKEILCLVYFFHNFSSYSVQELCHIFRASYLLTLLILGFLKRILFCWNIPKTTCNFSGSSLEWCMYNRLCAVYKMCYTMLGKTLVSCRCDIVCEYVVVDVWWSTIMSPGCTVKCKLCHWSCFAWKFVMGADYYVVKFSVNVGTVRLGTAYYDGSSV
jgi:hypothetical protein